MEYGGADYPLVSNMIMSNIIYHMSLLHNMHMVMGFLSFQKHLQDEALAICVHTRICPISFDNAVYLEILMVRSYLGICSKLKAMIHTYLPIDEFTCGSLTQSH